MSGGWVNIVYFTSLPIYCEALSFRQNCTVIPGDAKFQAFGNASCSLNEVVGRSRRANSLSRMLEQFEPAVKVARVDR